MNKFFAFIFILFFGLCCTSANAQDEDANDSSETEVYIQPDTTFYYSGLHFPESKISEIKRNKEYAYLKYIDSLLKDQKKTSLHQQSAPKPSNSWFEGMLNAFHVNSVLAILAIFIIIIIAYYFIVRNRIFSRATKKSAVTIEEETREEHLQDHYTLYQQSKNSKDYRSAIKYLFLHTLQQLSEKELVVFTPDKTNHEYLLELPNSFQKDFAALSLVYEFTWYGKKPLDEAVFQQKENMFIQFINRISYS